MSKPFVVSEIEIPFAPKNVKDVVSPSISHQDKDTAANSKIQFLDFEHFSEMKSSMIPEIRRKPGVSGITTEGETLDIDFGAAGWGVTTITVRALISLHLIFN